MNNSNDSGPETSNDKALQTLEKQLTIETKVKNGTENMIQSILQNYQSRDKKLLAEAHNMLADSKAKIEFLKLKILKVKQNRQLNKVSERENCSSFSFFPNFSFFMKLFFYYGDDGIILCDDSIDVMHIISGFRGKRRIKIK